MASLVEDRTAVARAAIASTIAARTGMRLVGTTTAGVGAEDDHYLTLCSTPPAGYHMEAELIPLEIIMRDVEGIQSGDGVEPREMTTADHFLEELNAFVHNSLLNPVLPLAPWTPGIIDTETIDDIYGEILQGATFAGGVVPDSARYKEASELLFDEGAASEALETYRAYETRAKDARDAVAAVASADAEGRDLAEQRLQRIEAEWIGIGKRLEIEAAFRTLQAESEAAGFQDERVALLERFRAGEEKRIDLPGMSYHAVKIVPISPLLTDTGSFWQHVELDADGITEQLSLDAQLSLSLTRRQILRATDRLRMLAFDFVVCNLIRDWINPHFFSARYWRLDPDVPPLSDGAGGGRLPALPTRAIFIRGARVEYDGERSASPGTLDGNAPDTKPTFMATFQIAPDLTTKEDEKTSKILEAAKRRGLTSSLSLLQKESKRISSHAVRKAVAVSPDITSTISMARLQPAATRHDSSSFAIHALPQPIKASRVARDVDDAPTRMTAQVSSRIRTIGDRWGHPGKSRPRPEKPRRPRVRDHRSPRTSITLSIDGVIETTDGQKDELQGISLHYLGVRDDDERTIRLVEATPTSLTFSHEIRDIVREGQSISYHIILRDRDENELDRRLVEAEDDEDITLNWVIHVEQVVIELAGQLTPTLHAYGLTLLPRCPNPDEGLDWS